jgi:hypothetical protein
MNMFVAIATVHPASGCFRSWTGTRKGEGFEYHGFTPNIELTTDQSNLPNQSRRAKPIDSRPSESWSRSYQT